MVNKTRSSPRRTNSLDTAQKKSSAQHRKKTVSYTSEIYENPNYPKEIVPFAPDEKFKPIIDKYVSDKNWFTFMDHLLLDIPNKGISYSIFQYINSKYVLKIQPADDLFYNEIRALFQLQKTGLVPKVYAAWTYDGDGIILMQKLEQCGFLDRNIKRDMYSQIKRRLEDLLSHGWLVNDMGDDSEYLCIKGNIIMTNFRYAIKKEDEKRSFPSYGGRDFHNFPITWKLLVLQQKINLETAFGLDPLLLAEAEEKLDNYKEEVKKLVIDLVFYGVFNTKDESPLKHLQQGYRDILPMIFGQVDSGRP